MSLGKRDAAIDFLTPIGPSDDSALVSAAKSGANGAFVELFKRYWPKNIPNDV